MGDRLTVSNLINGSLYSQHVSVRVRPSVGDSRQRPPPVDGLRLIHQLSGCEPIQQVLKDILRSASGVLSASQAFIVVSQGGSILSVAATHNIRPVEVANAVLVQASKPIHAALREKILAAGDLQGCVLPPLHADACPENRAPAVLCVPLDIGSQQRGVMCMLRQHQPRRLSDLDLEIVQALGEQAALAISAASHSSALQRLQASLTTLAPAYA